MISNLLYVFILVLAFPVGYLLAWLAKDELVAGRRWFILIAIISVIAQIPVALFIETKLPAVLTLLFLAIICLVAVWKSKDKKWVGKKK